MAWNDLGLKYPYCAICRKPVVPMAGHSYDWRKSTPAPDVQEAMQLPRFGAGIKACADEPNDRQVLVCTGAKCSALWREAAENDGEPYTTLRVAPQERKLDAKPSDAAAWAAKSAVLERIVLAARAKLGAG